VRVLVAGGDDFAGWPTACRRKVTKFLRGQPPAAGWDEELAPTFTERLPTS